MAIQSVRSCHHDSMTRLTSLAVVCFFGLAACSSETTSGATSDGATTSVDSTTTVAGDVSTTSADPAVSTSSAEPVTTPAATAASVTAAPATAAPATAAPTTVACRNVGNLYGLSDVSGVNVRRGDCGEGVRQVQDQLNYKLGISLTVDGRFGAGTEAAVRDFQELIGLPVDGVVSPMTWVALTDDDI